MIGHGVPDEGAQSSRGTTEAETNLKIALKLQNLLEQSGCTVILTRSDENAIYDLDKIPQQQYWGWQCFYNSKNEKSINLAKKIQSNLNESIQKDNKRVAMKLDTVYIMKHVEIPISIVECGFLSNPEEEQQLLDDEYQNKLAWGIFNGIIEYFNE